MFISRLHELSRRAFLRRSGQLAVLGGASTYALGLAGLSDASAFESNDEYKALVCVFLNGGNDHANTLIPHDEENYRRYRSLRGAVSLKAENLANSVLRQPDDERLTDDIQYALAPSMPFAKSQFDEGNMAFLLNVGPLEVPLTRAQYDGSNRKVFPIPPRLFSHNDQQSTWQSSKPEGAPTGWGGRIADLAQSMNDNAMFTAISATGNGIFLRGDSAAPYRIDPRGAALFKPLKYNNLYGSPHASNVLKTILTSHSGSLLAADYAQTNARAIEYGSFMNEVLASTSIDTQFDDSNPIEAQLSVVARLIAARERVGVKRQVFMVSMGGFDHHGDLIGKHETLLGKLDSALDAFYRSTLELGVADKVTTFTASDFGRTLSTNGDGSDHGWGGHHFILGGSVNGGRLYGTAPHLSVTSNDQVGRGRLLPSTSVDEYSATLARWFGVPTSELQSIAPNIGRFRSSNLGFMQAE